MTTSILFAVSALGRSRAATYLVGILLYSGYFLAAGWTNSPLMAQSSVVAPEEFSLFAFADPFGISAFFDQTRFWTVDQKNSQLIGLGGALLASRSWALAVGCLSLGVVFWRFQFQPRLVGGRRLFSRLLSFLRPSADPAPEVPHAMANMPNSYLTVAPERRLLFWGPLAAIVKLEVRSLFTSLPFLGMWALWILIVTSEILTGVFRGDYGSSVHPTSGLLAELIGGPLPEVLPATPRLFRGRNCVARPRLSFSRADRSISDIQWSLLCIEGRTGDPVIGRMDIHGDCAGSWNPGPGRFRGD